MKVETADRLADGNLVQLHGHAVTMIVERVCYNYSSMIGNVATAIDVMWLNAHKCVEREQFRLDMFKDTFYTDVWGMK